MITPESALSVAVIWLVQLGIGVGISCTISLSVLKWMRRKDDRRIEKMERLLK